MVFGPDVAGKLGERRLVHHREQIGERVEGTILSAAGPASSNFLFLRFGGQKGDGRAQR